MPNAEIILAFKIYSKSQLSLIYTGGCPEFQNQTGQNYEQFGFIWFYQIKPFICPVRRYLQALKVSINWEE